MATYEGILPVKKPFGVTSHDVINKLRRILQMKRIGHTGTLDPRATGLLVICLGRATKITQFLNDDDKAYEAEIKLGIRSTTYDAEGIIIEDNPPEIPELNEDEVIKILNEFKGRIKQKVPAYSAVKKDGQPLYKAARKGKEVDTPEREIVISHIKLNRLDLPFIEFSVSCSKGTYIRALANDIGEIIGCGAYLSKLNRTRVGRVTVSQALSLKEIQHYYDAGAMKRFIIPIEQALGLPLLKIKDSFAPHVLDGQTPKPGDISGIDGVFAPGEKIVMMSHSGKALAVGTSQIASEKIAECEDENFFKYIRVLN